MLTKLKQENIDREVLFIRRQPNNENIESLPKYSILMFDCRRAFDLIDHRIFVTKLSELDIPISVVNWFIALLSHHSQESLKEQN